MAQGLFLSQKLSMQQVLAPQLQQSLALLQAPTLELKALVEQELQQNPLLEEVQSDDQDQDQLERPNSEADTQLLTKAQEADPTEPPADVTFDPATEKPSNEPVDDFQAEFERLTQLDQEWRDHFAETNIPMRASQEDEEKRQFMFDSMTVGTSLQEHLMEQIRLSELSDEQRPLAEILVGNIDDYGYLKATIEEMSYSTAVPQEKFLEVLKIIQSFHPVGVGARDLRECLLLQMARLGKQKTLEYKIVQDYMDALGKRRMPEIARGTGEDVVDVQKAIARIGLLEPRPGRAFLPDNDQYVLPEVFVVKQENEFLVTTNNEQIPHLRISNTYKDLMAQADSSSEVREYIREKIRAGKFLIKSLHQRQETIRKIGMEIVVRQREVMEKGVSFLKPLTMVKVAEVVGVHETTVSRAVSGKYIQTPQGTFEMKYFFTSGIQTSSGDGMSNGSVKDMMGEILKREEGEEGSSFKDALLASIVDNLQVDVELVHVCFTKKEGEHQ